MTSKSLVFFSHKNFQEVSFKSIPIFILKVSNAMDYLS